MDEEYAGKGGVEHIGIGPEPSPHRLHGQVEEAVVESQPESERGQQQHGSTEEGDATADRGAERGQRGPQIAAQFDSVMDRSGEQAVVLPT